MAYPNDMEVANAARAYVWALEEPEPREGWDSSDDYYTTGRTSDELLDHLKALVHAELREAFDAVRERPKSRGFTPMRDGIDYDSSEQ